MIIQDQSFNFVRTEPLFIPKFIFWDALGHAKEHRFPLFINRISTVEILPIALLMCAFWT
jgi:hypothetical protein